VEIQNCPECGFPHSQYPIEVCNGICPLCFLRRRSAELNNEERRFKVVCAVGFVLTIIVCAAVVIVRGCST
jgi:hypothetical protein